MNCRTGLLCLAAVALGGFAPVAEAQIPATQSAFSPKAAGDDDIVCKRQKNSGTRFDSKVCKTRGEWNAIREQNMRDLKEATSPGIQVDSANPNTPN